MLPILPQQARNPGSDGEVSGLDKRESLGVVEPWSGLSSGGTRWWARRIGDDHLLDPQLEPTPLNSQAFPPAAPVASLVSVLIGASTPQRRDLSKPPPVTSNRSHHAAVRFVARTCILGRRGLVVS
jgi:hypothetical protein